MAAPSPGTREIGARGPRGLRGRLAGRLAWIAGGTAALAVVVAFAAALGLLAHVPLVGQFFPGAGWQVYHDPAGLFTVRMPAGWSAHFADEGQATEGDLNTGVSVTIETYQTTLGVRRRARPPPSSRSAIGRYPMPSRASGNASSGSNSTRRLTGCPRSTAADRSTAPGSSTPRPRTIRSTTSRSAATRLDRSSMARLRLRRLRPAPKPPTSRRSSASWRASRPRPPRRSPADRARADGRAPNAAWAVIFAVEQRPDEQDYPAHSIRGRGPADHPGCG